MNGAGQILLLLLGIALILLVTSERGRQAIDVLLGRKRAT